MRRFKISQLLPVNMLRHFRVTAEVFACSLTVLCLVNALAEKALALPANVGVHNTLASHNTKPFTVVYTLSDPAFKRAIEGFADTLTAADTQRFVARWVDQTELKTRLLSLSDNQRAPDIVIGAADILALANQRHFSPIDDALIVSESHRVAANTLRDASGHLYGLPIAKGNHLVLYYNKNLVHTPENSWKALYTQQKYLPGEKELIGWGVLDMYWLIPFITAFGDAPKVSATQVAYDRGPLGEAIGFVWNLIRQGILDDNCDYACAKTKFIEGKLAYFMDGVWDYESLKGALNSQLGVATLPTLNGRVMRSYYSYVVMAFPANKGKVDHETSQKFIAFAQSAVFNTALASSASNFSLMANHVVSLAKSAGQDERGKDKDNLSASSLLTPEDKETIMQALDQSVPMPPHATMVTLWEALLKGFVRFGGNALTEDDVGRYIQNYTDSHLPDADDMAMAQYDDD